MSLRLFQSPQDAAQDAAQARREAAQARARSQTRCGACGRWQHAGGLRYGLICQACTHDTRPGIQVKVEQAKRWYRLARLRVIQSEAARRAG